MKITINGSLELTDEQIGALYDLTGCGENNAPPGFNTTSPVETCIVSLSRSTATIVAKQGELYAELIGGDWLTQAYCNDCGYQWFSDKDPETAECPRCEARYTRDRGEW